MAAKQRIPVSSATKAEEARPLRILHVVPSFHPAVNFGGPTVSLYYLCNHLAALPGIELRVMTTDTSGPQRQDRLSVCDRYERMFPGYRVQFSRKAFGVDFSPRLLVGLWEGVTWADVVHLTAVYSSPTIPTLFAAQILHKPVVWSPRGALQRWSNTRHVAAKKIWESVCNLLLDPRRTVLHVTSQKEGEDSALRIRRARPVVVENGVEVPLLLPQRTWRPSGQLRLLYLGRLDPIKGIDNLLTALASLRDDSIRLRVCGSGAHDYTAHLRNLAMKLGITQSVTFVGTVIGDAKSTEFLGADICVVPSHTENFGMVVAEALAHGVPVIASRGTPWREIETRGAGFWVSNTPESLAQVIARARSADLEALGRAGHQWMAEAFGWPSVAKRMLKVYRQLTSSTVADR